MQRYVSISTQMPYSRLLTVRTSALARTYIGLKHNFYFVFVIFLFSPHLYRVAAESLYTSSEPSASVRIVAYSRGGACPTGHGSTLAGTPLN